ncbi:MAG TPA: DNA methyltransferase [bacterium]|jgi:hypothetical protein|nr:DNA methyltransferase [bacterium]
MSEQQKSLFPDMDSLNASKKNQQVKRNGTRVSDAFISSVWSFNGSSGDQVYRWYGTLPRQLVEKILTLYAPKNGTILDPFMGLGPTLDAAADAKIKAVGLDVNPLACLAAETRLFATSEVKHVMDRVNHIHAQVKKYPSNKSNSEWSEIIQNPNYNYMRKWIRPDTLEILLTLLFKIADEEQGKKALIQFVAAAQVIRDVASVDTRCTHHLVTKKKPFIDPFPLWISQTSRVINAVRPKAADPSQIVVRQESALSSNSMRGIADLVIVHPPYLGVIHYHQIHRLATDLLDIVQKIKKPITLKGLDFEYTQLRNADISTDKSESYLNSIERLADTMATSTSADGRCVVIIGDQRNKGHLRHPFTDYIAEFEKRGFMLEENFIWLLNNNGGMHVLRRGHFIDHNYILVFHKTKHVKKK